MKENLNRRDFARRTASSACGILTAALLGDRASAAVTRLGPQSGDKPYKEHQRTDLRPVDAEY